MVALTVLHIWNLLINGYDELIYQNTVKNDVYVLHKIIYIEYTLQWLPANVKTLSTRNSSFQPHTFYMAEICLKPPDKDFLLSPQKFL
jgi:hypothetical protein